MALVPFSYANPFTDQLRLKERLFTIDGHLLRIRQAWKGDGKGGTTIGFGASVYPAAYVLAEYLERNPHLIRGKRVIELGVQMATGTGTGFLGIATALLGAGEVCLTDGDDQSVQLAEENVEANAEQLRARPSRPSRTEALRKLRAPDVRVRKLRWEHPEDLEAVQVEASGPWDVLIGSDIAALPYASAFGALLETILSLVRADDRSDRPSLPAGGGLHRGQLKARATLNDAEQQAETGGDRSCATLSKGRAPPVVADETRRCSPTGRKALVLLAHKRRHITEDAFFEALNVELGGSSHVQIGNDDLHSDFQSADICLHMFEIRS